MSRSMFGKLAAVAVVALAIASAVVAFPLVSAASPTRPGINQRQKPIVNKSIKNDLSIPLRLMAGHPSTGGVGEAEDDFPAMRPVRQGRPNHLDPHVQSSIGSVAAPATSSNFDGVGNGFSGPQGTFTVSSAPPDTNGAVGPQDYVQTVNSDFAVFNKDPGRGADGSVR